MIKNKKAISGIVMTVIMIVLVLVAVGVVWTVVQNLLEKNAEDIELGSDCLGLNFEITDLVCVPNVECNFTIKRTSSSSVNQIGGFEYTLINTELGATKISSRETNIPTILKVNHPLTIIDGFEADDVAVIVYLGTGDNKKNCQVQFTYLD